MTQTVYVYFQDKDPEDGTLFTAGYTCLGNDTGLTSEEYVAIARHYPENVSGYVTDAALVDYQECPQ